MSQKRRIGVFAHSLHDLRLRGVQRVARAVTEELLELLPADVEVSCLLHKVAQQSELTYVCCDLRTWLACNPLVPSQRRIERAKQVLRKGAMEFVPPIALRAKSWLTANLHRYRAHAPLARSLSERWGKLRQWMGKAAMHGLPCRWMMLDEFDTVISFEAFDDIWNEPTHRCRTRFISFFHDSIPKRIHEGPHWNPDRFDSCVTNACYRAHRIVCVSRSTQADLLTFFAPARGTTQVIHLGHDLAPFLRAATADHQTVDAVFRKHGISPRTPYFFCSGDLGPRMNIVRILRACEFARRRNPLLEFQLVLCQNAPGRMALRQPLKRARQWLPVRVLPYPTDEDAAILAANAEAFLFPSLWEGFGIPLLEAMTAGTLVVTSDISSMPEVCGPHALYCDPYDVRSIGERILQCLAMDAKERRERISAAQQHSSKFTWRKTAEALLTVIDHHCIPPERPTLDGELCNSVGQESGRGDPGWEWSESDSFDLSARARPRPAAPRELGLAAARVARAAADGRQGEPTP